jgi:NOL1/NOP2/sun family putative RNA methylase
MRGAGKMELPLEFVTKFKRLLADEAESFFDTYNQNKKSGLRINPLKITKSEFENLSPFKLETIPYVHTGFYYHPEMDQPGKHPYHAAGLYYIQEPSAMFIAEQLAPAKGDRVLDLCAAPGGKTTQLAGMMDQQGLLVANEINTKRAKALSENIERLGITNALVTNETPERLAERFHGYFDKILVDAPCSGEGMFRKDEEAIRFWSQNHVDSCARQQQNILDSAYKMLKKDGILVYSTCTFSPEENEQSIERFLSKYADMELQSITKPEGVQDGRPEWSTTKSEDLLKAARLWPHKLQGEGHFTAKLIKTSSTDVSTVTPAGSNLGKGQLKDFQQFCHETFINHSFENFFLFNQQLYSLPVSCPSFQGLRVLRAGLHLGELKKNRFEPNHALALSLKKEQAKQRFNLSSKDDQWIHYLKGETITTGADRGWTLVTIDGFSLGWGKEAKGILKNFYPKGLRIKSS